jgi:hypothetical protein
MEYLGEVAQRMPGLKPKTDSLTAIYQREIGLLEPLSERLPSPESVKPGWEWCKVNRDREIAVLVTARTFEDQALTTWQELAGTK